MKKPHLSNRDIQILLLACAGMTIEDTALNLNRSAQTIKNQRVRIMKKLNASNFVQAIVNFKSHLEQEKNHQCSFYLIDLGVYNWCKFGISQSMGKRLNQIKLMYPHALLIKTWDCRREWERPAIDSIKENFLLTSIGSEIFEVNDTRNVIEYVDNYFKILNSVEKNGIKTIN